MNAKELVAKIEKYNAAYRAGNPLISDEQYDALVAELESLDPYNPFFNRVEEEELTTKRLTVKHATPMLSLKKAYKSDEIKRFGQSIHDTLYNIDESELNKLKFIITPKLDGLASKFEFDNSGPLATITNMILSTRGNGSAGSDISDAFEKGIEIVGAGFTKQPVYGEICMPEQYFKDNMSDEFSHPRNLVVGAIMSDTLSTHAKIAFKDKMIQFVPYDYLKRNYSETYTYDELILIAEDIGGLVNKFKKITPWPIDGVVVDIAHDNEKILANIKDTLGSTGHHNKWQLAIKSKGETAQTSVKSITWQTGRTGKITPVLELVPVTVSGAEISRVTAHNAAMVSELKIGEGAIVSIIRSGEVIPKIEKVIKEAKEVIIPKKCPQCESVLQYSSSGVDLICESQMCGGKMLTRISHFFKMTGIDLFGPATIEKLIEGGFKTITDIIFMSKNDFKRVGISPRNSERLFEQLENARQKQIEDFYILASIGINNLGLSESKKLCKLFTIKELFDIRDFTHIDGFGSLTSGYIVNGLAQKKPLIDLLVDIFFTNVVESKKQIEDDKDDKPFLGTFVFTGTLSRPRSEWEAIVEERGGRFSSSITKSTDYLVCGENTGATKIAKAEKLGIKMINERELFEILWGEK